MVYNFDALTQEDVNWAIKNYNDEKIIEKTIGEKHPSTKYDLRKNGKCYPPKDIVRIAYFRHFGKKISNNFSGGDQTNNPLRNLGFEIVEKEDNVGMTEDNIEKSIKEALANNPQIILTGAPGTGKTYSARKFVAKKLGWDETTDLNDFLKGNSRFTFVQFHSGYDYTDFVQGYKPVIKNDEMTFVLKDGIFKQFCDVANEAKIESEKNGEKATEYYFIIDEINRADLSRVFGELFFGLEKDYRGTPMTTQYGDTMIIPENVKIIGTMNDVDRGVETIDFALRRRFIWIEVEASTSGHLITDKEIRDKWGKLNGAINQILGPEYEIGGSYFQGEMSEEDIIEYRVKPLLNEYLRGKSKKKEILLKFQDESGFDFGVKKETRESEE